MGEPNMFLNAMHFLFDYGRQLRANETEAEKILWSKLSRNQLGVKFRRQHPLHSYVVDFYCHQKKLVIELDGSIHDVPPNRFADEIRSKTLHSFGIRVLRFKNEDVYHQTNKVVEAIKKALKTTGDPNPFLP